MRTRNVKSNPYRRWYNTEQAQFFSSKNPVLAQDVENKASPAPVKGWDALSPLSSMEPDYAVILDNAVPQIKGVRVRGGYRNWFQGAGAAVETLMVFRPSDDDEELFAAAGGSFWDVSTYGSPAEAETGFTNDRWQYLNYTPALGDTHLLAVNGADPAQIYDGNSWENANITGVTTSTLINIASHKRRIWFVERDSTNAWYLDTDAIAGAATLFELGSLFTKGSNLVAIGIWTIDGGSGPDDYAVFVSNKGQAVIFKGTDPGNADAWFHVGTFNLPPPLGNRCFMPFGSDLLYISMEGLLPISKALPFDPSGARSVALTNRIQDAMLDAAQTGREFFGWQTVAYPRGAWLVMNVPVIEDEQQVQFVMNTLTGAWCRFTGWNACCFEIYNESLFFGDNDGNVSLANIGQTDNISAIDVDVKTAFNYYDDPGRQKYVNMLRPYLEIGGNVTPQFGIDVDFGNEDFNPTTSVYQQLGSLWDAAVWDSSEWSGSNNRTVSNDWQTAGAIGTALAIHMKINITSEIVSESGESVFDSGLFDEAVFDGPGIPSESGDELPFVQLNSFQVNLEHGSPLG